jgi:hypothetical protein
MASVIASQELVESLPDRTVLSLIPSSLPLPADVSSLAGSVPASALAAPTAVQNAPITQGVISPPGL